MIAAWHAGFNDPDALGYLTTGGYLVSCLLCAVAAWTPRRTDPESRRIFFFWLVFAVSLFLLGLNKQLDLQDAMREIARTMATAHGWHGQRRHVQLLLTALIVVVVFIMVTWLFTKGRWYFLRFPLACIGAALVVSYAVIRAFSFNHTLGWMRVISLGKPIWLLEVTGVVFISIAAVRSLAAKTMDRPPRGE